MQKKFEDANYFLSSGMYAEAEEIYCSLITETNGRDAALLCKLGDLYFKKLNFDLALKVFDTVISINPSFPWSYICKANVYEEIGKYLEAKDCLSYVDANLAGYEFINDKINILDELMREESASIPEIFSLPKNRKIKHINTSSTTIAVIAWDIAHNPVGRAWALSEVANLFGHVCLQGPVNMSFGHDLWEPLRDAPRDFDITSFLVSDFASLMNGSIEIVKKRKFDVVIISKARFPSILIGILHKLIHGSKVILDIDDDELSFVGASKELDIDELIDTYEPIFWQKPYGNGWTEFANSLIPFMDGISSCNRAFHDKHGGIIIRHARDKSLFVEQENIPTKDFRINLGFSENDWIILFLGTAREYKGLELLAQSIQLANNPSIVLVIAGHLDLSLRNSLEALKGIRIVFYPTWPFQDMAILYSIANCICLIQDLKSVSANWQTPAKISDAFMFGVPIIATPTLGISEFIERNLVFKTKHDVNSIAESIQLLFDNYANIILDLKQKYFFVYQSEFSINANSIVLEQYIDQTKITNHDKLGEITSKLFKFIDRRMPGLLSDSWREEFGNIISSHPVVGAMTNPNLNLNIVLFWKQNDSGIYDRRHDMLINEMSDSESVSKILQIDAPICIDEVIKGLSLNAFDVSENNIQSEIIIQRYLKILDDKRVARRTFIYRGKETHILGQKLPLLSEFPNYVEQWIRGAGMMDNVMAWVYPAVPDFEIINNRIGFSFILADLVDDQSQFKQKASTLRKINKSYKYIFKVADVVITNCHHNFSLITKYGATPYLVANALSINLNKIEYVKPELLKKMNGPIIGYAGNMRDRIDWHLIKTIASDRPDWNIVLIGEIPNQSIYQDLISFPNVHFLGVIPAHKANHYINFFDVGIIPHINDRLSQSMNPLKMYLYRGLGLYVVSTNVPNLGIKDSAVMIASTKLFIDAIDKMLYRKSKDGKMYISAENILSHSWSARLSSIFELINSNFK